MLQLRSLEWSIFLAGLRSGCWIARAPRGHFASLYPLLPSRLRGARLRFHRAMLLCAASRAATLAQAFRPCAVPPRLLMLLTENTGQPGGDRALGAPCREGVPAQGSLLAEAEALSPGRAGAYGSDRTAPSPTPAAVRRSRSASTRPTLF